MLVALRLSRWPASVKRRRHRRPQARSQVQLRRAGVRAAAASAVDSRQLVECLNSRALDESGLQVGDALLGEADVGSGAFETFLKRAVLPAELLNAVFECGVLGGQ
ncbi:hypothetical protein [Kitasatospora sp. NPDC085879]|uniref:hypothetical protein n=1 Tax=Kitasatospora sp. NPDC085879 TaxID=3154769 RepID=UPI00342F69BE